MRGEGELFLVESTSESPSSLVFLKYSKSVADIVVVKTEKLKDPEKRRRITWLSDDLIRVCTCTWRTNFEWYLILWFYLIREIISLWNICRIRYNGREKFKDPHRCVKMAIANRALIFMTTVKAQMQKYTNRFSDILLGCTWANQVTNAYWLRRNVYKARQNPDKKDHYHCMLLRFSWNAGEWLVWL